MGGTLAVTCSDIYVVKKEDEIVASLKPKFYRRDVNDIFNQSKKYLEGIVFKRLHNYHQKIKLTLKSV